MVRGAVWPRYADRLVADDDRLSGIRRGRLEVLAQYQATERDDYRDAEPGKILHELRYGELAHFKLIPHTPYYGTADATPLYLVALTRRGGPLATAP